VSLQRSTVSALPASLPANGQASAVVTVMLMDSAGAPYGKSGGALELSTTSGSMSAVVDKGDGTYTGTITSSTVAGIAVVNARLAGVSLADTAGVQFLPGPVSAATVANPSTNNQTAVVGAAVSNPPSVKVADAFGNGVADITVTFAVTSGGGSVTGPTQKTNAAGVATVGGWTLGNIAGANTLTATISGAAAVRASEVAATTADLTVTFTATAVAGAPGSISLAGGDGQTAVAGTAVTTAPSVKVVDAGNNPVSGASVSFFVATGGGSITGASTTTNASGIAAVGSWTLGNTAGSNTLTAAAAGVSGLVTISAVGIPGPAAAIAIANAGSNNQSAAAGTALPVQPSVKVTDSRGNGVAGVAVTFAVASGGGSVTAANATTNSAGVATVGSWTLGAAAGPNSLVASSGSLSGSPVTFNATGTAGAPGLITIVAGDAQTAVAGTAAAIAPSVKVTDQNGNAVAGATVTFTVVAGGGSIAGGTATSNASGIATAGAWTLGVVSGENRLAATSGSLTATFTATGTAGAAALIAIDAGNGQSAIVGTNVSIAPSVKVTDALGNAVSGAGVTFAVTAGGGSITGANASSSAAGIASVGSWTLGASAGANTLSASLNGVAGATVSFTATGAAMPPLVVSVSGRLERSQTVSVTVTQNGSTLAPSAYTLTLIPADGGQVNGDGTVKLLKAGSLTLNATAGSATGNTSITALPPPLFVFDVVRAGFRHIWQVALDGGDLVQLTTNGSDNQHGTRVGDKLVFASARNGQNFDIFAMTVSTKAETNLTSTAGFPERDPTLSPNGQRVTFVSGESGLDRARYMNADGSGVAHVADNAANVGAIEMTPAWSPASDKVIFSSTGDGGTPDIWIAHTLGAVASKLSSPANGPFADLGAEWNGTNAVVFHTNRSGNDEIWITNTTGSTATKLTDGASPAWTADGRIVFVRYTNNSGALFWIDPANPSVVHPIDIGGGNAQRPSAVLP
jgi:adhesin/invasin